MDGTMWRSILLSIALLLVRPAWADDHVGDITVTLDGVQKTASVHTQGWKSVFDVRPLEPHLTLVDCSKIHRRTMTTEPSDGCSLELVCLVNGIQQTRFCRVRQKFEPLTFCRKDKFTTGLKPCPSDQFPLQEELPPNLNLGTFVVEGGVKKSAEVYSNGPNQRLVRLGTSTQPFNLPCDDLAGRRSQSKDTGGCVTIFHCKRRDDAAKSTRDDMVYCRIVRLWGALSIRHCGPSRPPNADDCNTNFKNAKDPDPSTPNEISVPNTGEGEDVMEVDASEEQTATGEGEGRMDPCEEENAIGPGLGLSEDPNPSGTKLAATQLIAKDGTVDVHLLATSWGLKSARVYRSGVHDGSSWLECRDLPLQPPQHTKRNIRCIADVACLHEGQHSTLSCQVTEEGGDLIFSQCWNQRLPNLEVCSLRDLGF